MYAAIHVALACGMLSLGPVDPWGLLRPTHDGWFWTTLLLSCHAAWALASIELVLRGLARRIDSRCTQPLVRLLAVLAVLLATAAWLLSAALSGAAESDARALLWLQLLPLGLWPAGLIGRQIGARRPGTEPAAASPSVLVLRDGREPLQHIV